MPRYARMARSAPDLSPQLNTAMRITETSPESRSSSSGFGSKNTSTQNNQSSQSGSTKEWRSLPPYRPPPPPPIYYHPQQPIIHHQAPQPQNLKYPDAKRKHPDVFHESPSYNMDPWLELINQMNAAHVHSPTKAVDVGSVDGHYEFDPATPTPTASTPTGPRDEQQFMTATATSVSDSARLRSQRSDWLVDIPTSDTQALMPFQRKRGSKNDNIEARVQAMKEEFNAYRKRQATRQNAAELESAC